jgi:hypothetical protein
VGGGHRTFCTVTIALRLVQMNGVVRLADSAERVEDGVALFELVVAEGPPVEVLHDGVFALWLSWDLRGLVKVVRDKCGSFGGESPSLGTARSRRRGPCRLWFRAGSQQTSKVQHACVVMRTANTCP